MARVDILIETSSAACEQLGQSPCLLTMPVVCRKAKNGWVRDKVIEEISLCQENLQFFGTVYPRIQQNANFQMFSGNQGCLKITAVIFRHNSKSHTRMLLGWSSSSAHRSKKIEKLAKNAQFRGDHDPSDAVWPRSRSVSLLNLSSRLATYTYKQH